MGASLPPGDSWGRESLAAVGVVLVLVVMCGLEVWNHRPSANGPQGPEVQLGGTIVTFHQMFNGRGHAASLRPPLIDVEVRVDDGTTQYLTAYGTNVAGCRAGRRVTVYGVQLRPGVVEWQGLVQGGCVLG